MDTTSPIAPDVMSSFAVANEGWVVDIAPQLRGTPASAQAPTIRSASSSVFAMGFSVTMPFAPFSTAATVRSARPRMFVATATRSGLTSSSIAIASV